MCDVSVPHVQPISTELLYCFSSVFVELLSSIFILQPKFGPTSPQTRHSDEENLSVGCSPSDNHRRLNVYFKFHTLQESLLSSDVISLWILTTATAASLVTLTTYGILSAVGGSLTPQVWTTEEVEAWLPLPSVILGGATGIYRSKKKEISSTNSSQGRNIVSTRYNKVAFSALSDWISGTRTSFTHQLSSIF